MNNMDIKLPIASAAWGTNDFSSKLKAEIESFDANALGLNQYATGFYTTTDEISVMVLAVEEKAGKVEARIMILFSVTEEAYVCPVGMETRTAHYQYEGRISLNPHNTLASLELSQSNLGSE
jgi:hypothetical protein